MVTYYNRKDLVEFGNYLLSEERRSLIEQRKKIAETEGFELPKEEKGVDRSDVENWMSVLEQGKNPKPQSFKSTMRTMEGICENSLSSKAYKKWRQISEELRDNHS